MWQISDDKISKWNYLDGDEFNATNLDTTMWRDSYLWGRNLYCNRERQYYSAQKNHALKNGTLSLIARQEKITARAVPEESDAFRLVCNGKEAGTNLMSFDYTSGMIFSKQKYTYGYFEIRFKCSSGKGLWPAFWMFAGHETDEIDIFELVGSRNQEMHVDVHCKDGCKNYRTGLGLAKKNWGDYLMTSSSWENGFNIIGAEWSQGYIKWFLNGKPVAYWKGNFNYSMWLIANLAIANDNGPFGPGPDHTTKFPASFDIDYIRIWSKQSGKSSKEHQTILDHSLKSGKAGTAELTKKKRPEWKNKYLKGKSAFILFSSKAENSYIVELNSSPPDNLIVEVTDSQGKQVYQSTDTKQKLHQFNLNGRGKLKITFDSKVIEHPI